MFIIDSIAKRMKSLGDDIQFLHKEKIIMILVWPIFAFFFWYNFFRYLFGGGE